MEFFVFDNIETYNKRFVFDGFDKTRLYVDQIYIPETGAFWYRTEYSIIEDNVNLHGRYLHLHAGLTQFHKMQFDNEPHAVKRTELFYNPDSKIIEITIPKRFFRKNTIFKKKALYLGTKLPDNKMTIIGEIIVDVPNQRMNFILNYFPQHKNFKFGWELQEPSIPELMAKEETLKDEVKIAEDQLKTSSS